MNCWEHKNCLPGTRDHCPAYPNRGLECWKVTGTKCDGGKLEMATRTEKIEFCSHCDFYLKYASKF